MPLTHPRFGARFRFELESGTESEAQYTVALFLPDRCLWYRATIQPSGEVNTESLEVAEGAGDSLEPAPDWANTHMVALAKQLARAAKRAPWQRKLVRWKDQP